MVAAIVLALVLILTGYKPQGKGLVLGTIFSIVNFVVLGRTLSSRIGKSQRRAMLASLGSIAIRLAVMAIPLAGALFYAQFDVVAVAAGLFMVQMTILAGHVFGRVGA